eukprot:465519-Rhodomonas_salina.1
MPAAVCTCAGDDDGLKGLGGLGGFGALEFKTSQGFSVQGVWGSGFSVENRRVKRRSKAEPEEAAACTLLCAQV